MATHQQVGSTTRRIRESLLLGTAILAAACAGSREASAQTTSAGPFAFPTFCYQNAGNSELTCGANSEAIGFGATAYGNGATASSTLSAAFGSLSTASGVLSTAIGDLTVASKTGSTAVGFDSLALGTFSTAVGLRRCGHR